jgi:hypothetical protein
MNILGMLNIFNRGANYIDRPTSCSVCLDDFSRIKPNDCLKLRCGHIFHTACVERWVNEERSCPNCRAHSVLRAKESLSSVINKVKGPAIEALKIGKVIVTHFILPPLATIAVLNTAWRALNNLPLIPSAEEQLETIKRIREHNLALGYDFDPFISTKTMIITISLIPIVICAGTTTYLFAKHYFKNRIIMDRNTAVQINYIPPAED